MDPAKVTPEPHLIEHLRHAEAPCPGCGYSMRGARSPRCPECGRAFTFTDLEAGPPEPGWGMLTRWPGWWACGGLLTAIAGLDWLAHPAAGEWLEIFFRSEHGVPAIPGAAYALLAAWALYVRPRHPSRRMVVLKLAWGLTGLYAAGVAAMSL